jgi:hypothetical protein
VLKIQPIEIFETLKKMSEPWVTISEDVDVCVAFETMNNRGKPLSYLELLKNRLIAIAQKSPCACRL